MAYINRRKVFTVIKAGSGKDEQTKTVALSMASGDQVITPDANKTLSKVTVTKPDTLVSENIKKDVVIGGVTGSLEAGITPTGNINLTNTTQTDVTNYATAQVVDANLVAGNIKNGVSILGITGNYSGGGTTTHPFIICKSTWRTSNITVTIGSWSHTFTIQSNSGGYSIITYEDLISQGWDNSYSFSCSINVVQNNTPSSNSKIDFLGFMSSSGPNANIHAQSVSSNSLTMNMSTSSSPMGNGNYSCFALITCGLLDFDNQ